jgi:type IV pilus assembly protein PilY1
LAAPARSVIDPVRHGGKLHVRAFGLACGLATLLAPALARAQADVNPPLRNVLLLVDTSGSMEFKTDGSEVVCNPSNPAGVNQKSRWIDLVEVLTGTIENYTCEALDRRSTTFKTGEYKLAVGQPPYDYNYPIPFHRPLSGGCAAGPGAALSGNPFIYPTTAALNYHSYSSNAACTFAQRDNDGILDVFRGEIRFGLMTFDTSIDPGTGFGGSMGSATVNNTSGQNGLWSYIVGDVATGAPSGCAPPYPPQEAGARNAAAPPWEGRMINFGNPHDGVRAYERKNRQIQDVLVATRPFGATPIAGMLRDAEDFLLNDTSKDPDPIPAGLSSADWASDFGPREDRYLTCGRKQEIILLTDGRPNLDLRPYCSSNTETPAGRCPFDPPETTVARLKALAGDKSIVTHVVGFALDKVDHDNNAATATVECGELVTTAHCAAPAGANNIPLQACCTLEKIALAAGNHAHFAADRGKLRGAISSILSQGFSVTSRTQPVAAGGGSNAAGSFRFFSGFEPGALRPWTGRLERERWSCNDPTNPGIPTRQPFLPGSGDDFVHNVNVGGPTGRRIYTYLGRNSSTDPIDSRGTIRPRIGSTADGAGTRLGQPYADVASNFATGIPLDAIAIPTSSCVDRNGTALGSASACRKQYMEWLFGLDGKERCVSPGTDACRLIGDIFHSTPQVVGSPSAALRDPSYARFALTHALRPVVLYTSTNDGFLHAFKVTSNNPTDFSDPTKMVQNDSASNELWAFAPPAVLPNLYHLYPYNHQLLLDGIPTIADVVAVTPTTAGELPTTFERTSADAQSGANSWRTVLVQGFGAEHSGYFALDVTNPVPDTTAPNDVTKGGPRMLWQLTHDSDGKNLFGRGGATPAITSLYFAPSNTSPAREIPVAILPGGPGGTQVSTGDGCPAAGRAFTDSAIDDRYPPREKVHCYDFSTGDTGARSLTIVRLDTGEIIRTFRQDAAEVNTTLQGRVIEAELDSPITGQPVPYPALAGAVADRIFVGDQDGRLWKVDVSSANPSNWSMKLFFDLYPASFAGTSGHDFDDGQPIVIPPVVSVDDEDQVTLNVATGSQEGLGAAPGQQNYVYSLTEDVDAAQAISSKVTWYKKFGNGERIVGPMVLFNGELFFASFTPAAESDSCSSGVSRVWGMNYVEPEDVADRSKGGLHTDHAIFEGEQYAEDEAHNAVVFGVSLVQQPSCYQTDDDAVGDDLLGQQGQKRVSQINTGKFELVMHTGSLNTGSAPPGSSVFRETIELSPPDNMSYVESWASIAE